MSAPNADAHLIHSRIWAEEAEPDNAFATHSAHCHGYDVYGGMLGKATWADMVFLMLRGEAPDAAQERLFDTLAMALANPGPRAPSVHAAMCGGVAGSTAAASLIAALSVGAGGYCGAREVLLAMQQWRACGTDIAAWQLQLAAEPGRSASIWPVQEHTPGFDPHTRDACTIVLQTLDCLAGLSPGRHLPWLLANLAALEAVAGCGLGMGGVAAAALHDLGFTPAQGEMLFLMLRLPGAAAHALEQGETGFRKFPFFTIEQEAA
ncbi:MAG: citryl-CoA lyase [Pseudomonadota bacterium]